VTTESFRHTTYTPVSRVSHSMSATGDVSQSSSTSVWNSTDGGWLRPTAEQKRLRENLEWLYEPDSTYQVFVICLLIICGGELFQSPTAAMADAVTLQILGRDELDKYAAQRAWGPLGWAAWYERSSLSRFSYVCCCVLMQFVAITGLAVILDILS